MVYIFDEIDCLPEDFPELCAHCLSAERRKKVFSYRFPLDKKLSAAVYLLLRFALKESYQIDEPVSFIYGENGKPFLRGYPAVHFNLSHCRSAVACFVSDSEVGVDVQEVVPVSYDLARRVLSGREFDEFKSAENPDRKFCEYWTVKESWLKKIGVGIETDLRLVSPDTGFTLYTDANNYCCCAAGASNPLRRVGVPELLFTGDML